MRMILFLLLISPITFAFKLSPMSLTLEKNSQFKGTVQIENESSEPMAIEISIAKRIMDESGKETHPIVTNLFQIYPEQIILSPKQKRSVRIEWKGDKKIKEEKAFRLIAEQLPIEVDGKSKTGIKLLLKYIAAIYIAPEDTKSKIEISLNSQKENTIQLHVKNTGTKHQILKDAVLILTMDKEKKEFTGDAIKALTGENILAGGMRVFNLKIPGIKKVDSVEIKYND